MIFADREPRVQRRERVLVHQLRPAAQRPQRPAASVDRRAVEQHRPRVGAVELQHEPRDGRLARAGLADQAERALRAATEKLTSSTAWTVRPA